MKLLPENREQEIIEGNKIIAEFDGWTYHEINPIQESWWSNNGKSWVDINPPSFDNEWELLMGVFEKINHNPKEIAVYIEESGVYVFYVSQSVRHKWRTEEFPLKECLWRAILDAIKHQKNKDYEYND